MKRILLLLALIISSISFAQDQKSGLSEGQAQDKWTDIPARKSTTDNPDDGYPNVIEVTPRKSIPTLGELKVKIVKLMGLVIKDPRGISEISNYSNMGNPAWDCTYTEVSKNKPGYDKVYNIHFYFGKDPYSGKVTQRMARTGMKLVHRKTGEVIEL